MRSNMITLRLVFFISFSSIFVASTDYICSVDEHFCLSTLKCISKDYLCDGDNDCGDFSDERLEICPNAHALTCEQGQFRCFEKCISEKWVCDGDADCDKGEDEDILLCLHGPRPVSVTTRATTIKAPCLSHQMDCGEKCIRMTWVCDGDQDCDDGSDEAEGICSTKLHPTPELSTLSSFHLPLVHFSTPACTPDQFDCRDGCIARIFVCDGHNDCSNGIDEKPPFCPLTTLQTPYYKSRMEPVQTFAESTPPDTLVQATREHQTTSNDRTDSSKIIHADQSQIQLSTSTLVSSDGDEDCIDGGTEDIASMFTWLNWMECMLIVLGLVLIVIGITFICIKRRIRKHSANLHSRTGENRTPTVSYLNSPSAPNCQLVLVSNAVRLEPALKQPTTSEAHLGQPPPYNTLPAPVNQQNFSKGHECLV